MAGLQAYGRAAGRNTLDPLRFSTELIPPREQRDAWSDWFRPVFDVHPEKAGRGNFLAEYLGWQLGEVTMTRVSAPAARTVRTRAHLRRSPEDHWVVTLCQHGPTELVTKDVRRDLSPGVPFVWSLGHASDSRRTVADRLQLYLPRDRFHRLGTVLDAAVGPLDTPFGRLLGDYMLALERVVPSLSPSEGAAIADAIREMIAAAAAPVKLVPVGASDQMDLARMQRARTSVRRHLRSPVLGLDMLCRLLGISRSSLYRLMEPEGGVARYIRRARLHEAHAVLSKCPDVLISRLADEFCFADVSAFCRAFKKEFGCTPGDRRLATRSMNPAGAVTNDQGTAERADFRSLLGNA